MKAISVFGLGYVGAVTAACFAHKGNLVIGVDLNPTKVETLGRGRAPIVEEKVGELVAEGHASGHLRAIQDATRAVAETEVSFICVGTPSQRNGKLDLSGVQRVCNDIGNGLRQKRDFHWVVLRSTVLPGTTESVVTPALEASSGKRAGKDFAVCFHPEFLREGTAVTDFFDPPFTIFGANDPAQIEPLKLLYAWSDSRMFTTGARTAEMVKYFCNAFHALKVSFANEMGTLCQELAADTEAVTQIFVSDTRLNVSPAYLKPGFAFGGSCLPKDLRALGYRAKELDLRLPLLEAILPSNAQHIERAVEAVLQTQKKKIAVLGLSFKAGTDDLRESPLVHLVKRLIGEGCEIRIWDENVTLGRLIGSNRQFIEDEIPHIGNLFCAGLKETVESAEVIIIGTQSYRKEELQRLLRPEQVIIDLVGLEKSKRLPSVASYKGICW